MLRGGSWNNNENNVRCARRNNNQPQNRNNNRGVRVVVSHIFFWGKCALPAISRVGPLGADAWSRQ